MSEKTKLASEQPEIPKWLRAVLRFTAPEIQTETLPNNHYVTRHLRQLRGISHHAHRLPALPRPYAA